MQNPATYMSISKKNPLNLGISSKSAFEDIQNAPNSSDLMPENEHFLMFHF